LVVCDAVEVEQRASTGASLSGIHSRCENSASQGPWECGAGEGAK
jgi:hypothetical protein